MEAPPTKQSQPSSNFPHIASRLANIWRLKSMELFSSDKLRRKSNEETNWVGDDVMSIVMLKLFDTILTLKLAYIQLQQAHLPYDPVGIQAADDLIVSQIKTLYAIKKSCKNLTKPKPMKLASSPQLLELIQDRVIQLENLQLQVDGKDCEILALEEELEKLDVKNANLVKKIKRKLVKQRSEGSRDDAFANACKEASKAIHDFAKPLISLMKASSWDLDLAANSIEDSVSYSKRSHKKYAFEAYISRRMFHGFSFQLQEMEEEYITRYENPLDAAIKYPNSNFAKYCRLKYLLVVHPKMELSFFGNVDQRNLVVKGGHPRTLFYDAFVKMAKRIWLLQVIGASIDPKPEIFTVARQHEFSADFMENVVADEDACGVGLNLEEGGCRPGVGFMVTPGFKVGCSVIKSRVYVSRILEFTSSVFFHQS